MRQVCGLSEDGTKITLERFHGELAFAPVEARDPITAICLDIETTGLDKERDKIIDLGYIVFTFARSSRKIIAIKKEFNQLQDPGETLSDEVKRITGIRDEDLSGKAINWEEVAADLSAASVIIAHNAEFDRAFLDRYLPVSREKIWACSASQIEWRGKGHPSRALECLAMNHGFFYSAHTALIDAKATLKLLAMDDPDTKKTYLTELLSKASMQKKLVIAQGSRIDFKDELKKRGYRWNGKFWGIFVPADSFNEEEFISNNPQAGTPVSQVIPLKDNFKSM